jgi:type II secretory pathway pseudopilin PulG
VRTAAQQTPATSGASGFTIVEVVVAMGLLLLGMTSILGLLSFGAALSRTAQLRNSAAAAAEAVIVDLEETLFPLVVDDDGDVIVGEPKLIKNRPVPGHPGILYTAHSTGDPTDARSGGPLRYRVDVEIHWTTGGKKRSKTFTTLLLREVPFGERLRRLFVAGEEPEKNTDKSPEETTQ